MKLSLSEACELQAMTQELSPLGFNPLEVFEAYRVFLEILDHQHRTADVYFSFDRVINELDRVVLKGTILVSIHFSEYFSNIPIHLLHSYQLYDRLVLVMSKESRLKLPDWKQMQYQSAEEDLGLKILYVEDERTPLQLVKLLRKGMTVITFVDAKLPKKSNQVELSSPFLMNEILVPVGVFRLAQISKSKVIPIAAHTNSTLVFGPRLEGHDSIDAQIASSFRFFASTILTKPHEWTQWRFMYSQSNQKQSVKFNKPFGSGHLKVDSDEYQFNSARGCIEARVQSTC